MTPLCNINGKTLDKFLKFLGYKVVRQKGSHIRYKDDKGKAITLNVKGKKVIKPGRLQGLLTKDLAIKKEVFFDWLKLNN